MIVGLPILIELGDAEEREIEELLQGEGRLAGELDEVMQRLRERLAQQDGTPVLVPIVALAGNGDKE
jgi:hypothetical protein